MAIELMTNQPETSAAEPLIPPKPRHHEPTVLEIVEKARSAPLKTRGAWITAFTSAVLLWASFTPLDWGWLGWLALTPMCLLVRIERPTRAMYRILYASGFVWSLTTFQWMRYGDASMYPALVALSVYIAFYFPVFVGLSRAAVHRLGLPLLVAVPVVWTGLEHVRSRLMTGLSWYMLGHTQHAWPEMIQISDLVGAFGVTFLLALSSACIAGLVPETWLKRLGLLPVPQVPAEFNHLPVDGIEVSTQVPSAKQTWVPVLVTLSLVVLAFGYGVVRRQQADFKTGPRVALIQGNFNSSLKHDPQEAPRIFQTHDALTGMAVREQPDIVVWPETMFRWPLQDKVEGMTEADLISIAPPIPNLNRNKWAESWNDSSVRTALTEISQRAGAAVFIGLESWVARPDKVVAYNSAAFVTPQGGVEGRYDKQHRVIFGEYVPLKETFPFLTKLTPMPEDFGIAAGESAKLFRYGNWNLAPIICFEDTVPHLVRDIKQNAQPGVDVFVNLTNDGWFQDSSEIEQHLITSLFRAVECRTPLVRAVNTGISAVINGDGVVVEPHAFIDGDAKSPDEARTTMRDPKTGRFYKTLNAAVVVDVPLDNRTSLYVRTGDWFSGSCCFATVLFGCIGLVRRRKQ